MAVPMPVPPLLLAGRLSAEDSGHPCRRLRTPTAAPEGGYSGCVAALSKYVAQGKAINDAAAKAAAARAAAAPHVLLSMSGSGIANSAPFQVADSTVTARYSFDCSAFG